MQKTDRDYALDFIRLMATIMVICIHASAEGFGGIGQRHWWGVNVYESISRISVPLFFMVTGALVLQKEVTVSSILSRTWRVALPLLAWSVLYLGWFVSIGEPQFIHLPLIDWLPRILQAPVVGHLWYLYTLIGAYLFLPVMAGFFQANRLPTLLFVLGAWFVGATVVPTVFGLTQREYLGINWGFLPLYAGYMVLGATLYRKVRFASSPLPWACAVWAGSTVATAVLTWQHSLRVGQAHELYYVYSSPFVALGACAAFIALRELHGKYLAGRAWSGRVLQRFSPVAFGVYLVHVWVLYVLDRREIDFNFINPWLAIPLLTLGALALSAALIAILRKIPLLRAIAPA